MHSTRKMNQIRSITITLSVSLAILGAPVPAGHAAGALHEAAVDRTMTSRQQWIPDVQKEWERFGAKEFQPVASDRPHATIVFRDVADRTGTGAFDIWVLVDGQRVKDWTASSPLRVAPGAHCIRIEMVSIPARYQGTLGKYWPWLPADWEHTAQLTREAPGPYRIDYRPTRLDVKGLLDADEDRFKRDRPSDPEAAYAYCLKYVTEGR